MIQKLPAPTEMSRVETGPVQFGDDWPGYFMRGDNVAAFLMAFDSYKEARKTGEENVIMDSMFESMMEDFRSALL